jgi:hypothetical protein
MFGIMNMNMFHFGPTFNNSIQLFNFFFGYDSPSN